MAKRNDSPPAASKHANRLLAALPATELARLEPQLKRMELRHKVVLQEPEQRIVHVYFPLVGVISAVKEFGNGDVVEVATIGNEGMAGNSVALGVFTEGNRVLVQVEGAALCMEAAALVKQFASCPTLHRVLLRYSQALFHQVAQTAACNRAHTVDERCARWLLMTHDRVGSDTFTLTQEFLSQMLGVHRPTVSVAAGMLQKAGMITYVRGKVAILDRAALEEASCECYGRIVKHYESAFAS